jgi:hypothetical protein
MKRVGNVRRALADIPGALDGHEQPVWSGRGDVIAIWEPIDEIPGKAESQDLQPLDEVLERFDSQDTDLPPEDLTPIVELPPEF